MNSRAKGKRGELAACAYLRSLGFDAQRGARNGVKGGKDIMSVELSGVHIEVKCRESIDLGRKELDKAMKQAREDAGTESRQVQYENGEYAREYDELPRPYAVLWKPNRKPWRLTFVAERPPIMVTACGDGPIKQALIWLKGRM